MIKNNLAKIMLEKGLEKRDITRLTGIDRHVLDKIYKGKNQNIKLSILDKLCFALNCTPNEIYEYIPNNNSQ